MVSASLFRSLQASTLRYFSIFVCAIARQCFFNEFVFSVRSEEKEALLGLDQSNQEADLFSID